jgi:hypothetical protein
LLPAPANGLSCSVTFLKEIEDSMALSSPQVRDLAKKGAQARVEELRAELNSIYQSFPELRRSSVRETRVAHAVVKAARRRSRISAAGRERIRQAQLKRWAAVRAKKAR